MRRVTLPTATPPYSSRNKAHPVSASVGLSFQACYYLPWAVVATDDALGTELENAYVLVRASWRAHDTAALAAAQFRGEPSEVEAALGRLEGDVDKFARIAARVPLGG